MRILAKAAGAAALAVAVVVGTTLPAQAAGGSGTRTCTPPKEVALYSDQTGSGWHKYDAINTLINTVQPSNQRGQFNTFGATSSTSWTVYAVTIYSYGATCI
ncbi:hypothetical protein AB1K54_17280 [Microbacterium sp. BWT-B31]|uniref:hypothetical protein n=1 Tax=Microbacterium sp. BWT-B31 TaxID=3232072 RepID=UPI003526E3F3